MRAVIANRDMLFSRNGRRQWWLSAKTLFWAGLNAGCIGIADPQDILGQEEYGFILF
jgi:hypothetical protein